MPAQSLQFKFALGTGTTTATSVAVPSTSVSSAGTTYYTSQKEKGDGYFGSSDGLHTVTYTVTPNFAGTLTIQASLATTPVEADWFLVDNTTKFFNTTTVVALTTTTEYINFTGNFVWVRSTIHRSGDLPNGSVQAINYNH
jgi:hypothetical protein